LGYYYDTFGRQDFIYSGGTYTTLDDPSAVFGTSPAALNDLGVVAGTYYDGDHTAHGFTYGDGSYTTLDDPVATNGTYITGINDTGEIVGYYADGTGTHGFLYDNGAFSTLDSGLAGFSTSPQAISNTGNIVGTLSAPSPEGFLFGDDVYTSLIMPSASWLAPESINGTGEIAGSYGDVKGEHGFVYSNGSFTTLDDPFAATSMGTHVHAINDQGDVVGTYYDANVYLHAFIYSNGSYTTLTPPSENGGSTYAASINQNGDVVGYYNSTEPTINNSYQTVFFIATAPILS
jgi:probable HAF family extracellular repeat protein